MKIFHLPDLGEGLAEAEIREWYVKEGDVVAVDQPLVSMETAKAVVDVPSPYAGKIAKLHGNNNDIIKTGAAFITFEDESVQAEREKETPKERGSVVGALEESAQQWDESGGVAVENTQSTQTQQKQLKALPRARALAKELNVDLYQVTGTGANGLITPKDVEQCHQLRSSTSASAAADSSHGSTTSSPKRVAFTDTPEALRGVRRVMASVMTQSHQSVAATTIIDDIDISHLAQGRDLTVLIIQAMVAASGASPALNAWFDGETLQRQLFKSVHIGLATDTAEGLFVPVIKHAEQQTTEGLRTIINQYKAEVKDRTLSQANLQGATITLSNFGTLAGRYATPVVVPPTVAILGVGRYRNEAVVKAGDIVAGKILPLSLTFDHRAVTGGEATRFLAAVIQHIATS